MSVIHIDKRDDHRNAKRAFLAVSGTALVAAILAMISVLIA
jgi:hypothetical protein